jgi:GT2 family glycosyltransferase
VVSYRSGERAVRACRSAREAGAEVVLFDNSPGDGTADLLRREEPTAPVLAAGRNLGFATGSNRAAAGAGTDYLLFLNPDAVLAPGALDALVAALDADPSAGIAGPSITFPDGRPQPSVRRDPTAAAMLQLFTIWKFLFVFRGAYRRYRSPPAGAGPVEVVMGSALLARRALFEALGGFDERYFMYFEDADLCRRARERRAAVLFVPEAVAVHEGGASGKAAPLSLAAARLVSAQRYLRRFLPRGRYALFRAAFLTGFPLRAMFDLVRDLLYAATYAVIPVRPGRARRKLREALGAARLLTADFFRVVAG